MDIHNLFGWVNDSENILIQSVVHVLKHPVVLRFLAVCVVELFDPLYSGRYPYFG